MSITNTNYIRPIDGVNFEVSNVFYGTKVDNVRLNEGTISEIDKFFGETPEYEPSDYQNINAILINWNNAHGVLGFDETNPLETTGQLLKAIDDQIKAAASTGGSTGTGAHSHNEYALTNHDHSQYATTGALSNYATTSALSNYATTAALSNYATTGTLTNYTTTTTFNGHQHTQYLTAHQSLAHSHNQYANTDHKHTEYAYVSDLREYAYLPGVFPNTVLAGPSTGTEPGTAGYRKLVANDLPAHQHSQYLTAHQSLTNYYTKTEVNNLFTEHLNNYHNNTEVPKANLTLTEISSNSGFKTIQLLSDTSGNVILSTSSDQTGLSTTNVAVTANVAQNLTLKNYSAYIPDDPILNINVTSTNATTTAGTATVELFTNTYNVPSKYFYFKPNSSASTSRIAFDNTGKAHYNYTNDTYTSIPVECSLSQEKYSYGVPNITITAMMLNSDGATLVTSFDEKTSISSSVTKSITIPARLPEPTITLTQKNTVNNEVPIDVVTNYDGQVYFSYSLGSANGIPGSFVLPNGTTVDISKGEVPMITVSSGVTQTIKARNTSSGIAISAPELSIKYEDHSPNLSYAYIISNTTGSITVISSDCSMYSNQQYVTSLTTNITAGTQGTRIIVKDYDPNKSVITVSQTTRSIGETINNGSITATNTNNAPYDVIERITGITIPGLSIQKTGTAQLKPSLFSYYYFVTFNEAPTTSNYVELQQKMWPNGNKISYTQLNPAGIAVNTPQNYDYTSETTRLYHYDYVSNNGVVDKTSLTSRGNADIYLTVPTWYDVKNVAGSSMIGTSLISYGDISLGNKQIQHRIYKYYIQETKANTFVIKN